MPVPGATLFTTAVLAIAAGAACGGTVARGDAAASAAALALRGAAGALAVGAGAGSLLLPSLDRAAAERLLASVERAEPGLRRLAFVGKDGHVFASLGDPPAGARDARGEAAIAAAPGRWVAPVDGSALAALGAAVVAASGEPLGAIVGDADAALVARAVGLAIGDPVRCTMTDPTGRGTAVGGGSAADERGVSLALPQTALPGFPGWSIGCE